MGNDGVAAAILGPVIEGIEETRGELFNQVTFLWNWAHLGFMEDIHTVYVYIYIYNHNISSKDI